MPTGARSKPRTYRCTAEEHAALVERAASAGIPVSGFLMASAQYDPDGVVATMPDGVLDVLQELVERVRRVDACLQTLAAPVPGIGWSMLGAVEFLMRTRRWHAARPRPPAGAIRSAGNVPLERYSLSCPDAAWERVKVLAGEQGMSVSRWLVTRALAIDPAMVTRDAAAPGHVTGHLDLDEVRRRLRRIEERIVGYDATTTPLAGQAQRALAFLAVAAMERMMREGRAEDILTIAGELFDTEPLERIRAWVRDREAAADPS